MNSKYTFVFEYPDGKTPTISASTSLLGGEICSVAFHDAIEEGDILRLRIDQAIEMLESKSVGDDFDDVLELLNR
jgi:hypothetical protein